MQQRLIFEVGDHLFQPLLIMVVAYQYPFAGDQPGICLLYTSQISWNAACRNILRATTFSGWVNCRTSSMAMNPRNSDLSLIHIL